MSKSYNLLMATVCCLAIGFSEKAQAETLSEAVRSAVSANPTVDQAIAAQTAAHEEVTKQRSGYFPTLSLNTSAGRVYEDNATSRGSNTTRGAGYSNLWEGSLTASQMIFDGLKTSRMVGAGKAREAAAKATLTATREALAVQTTLAYLNILRARESLKVYQEYKAQLASYTDRIRTMVSGGMADESELQQAEVVMLDLENLILGFQGQEQSAQTEFYRLTGHMADQSLVRPVDVSGALPPTVEAAIALASHKHPQMLMADQEIEATGLEADAEQSSLYPNVTGELSTYRKDLKEMLGGEVDDDRAIVRATWKLSTGGAELASVRKAKQEEAQAKARKAETFRTLESAIGAAYSGLSTANGQRDILTQKLDASQKLLSAYRSQFEAGKIRILQLLQSENMTMNARVDLLNAEYRYLAAQYSVLGSIGSLQENLLAPVSAQVSNNAQ